MDRNYIFKVQYFKNIDFNYAFDSLSEVLNRESILGYYEYLINNKKPFTMALVDIDNFKIINDTYGHQVGDDIIHKFATALLDSVGEKGFVGRYGGDEFMLIIPDIVDYDDVWKIFHKINNDISNVTYETLNALGVTATIGVSRFPVDGVKKEEIFLNADKALYRGKSKGRNCFIIYLAAKHANITIQETTSKAFDSMIMINRVFTTLTSGNDLKKNIKDLLKYLSSYLMIDYLGIQTNDKTLVSVVNSLSRVKSFAFIPSEEFDKCMNGSGFFILNSRKSLTQNGNVEFFDVLTEAKVLSAAGAKINCGKETYGLFLALNNSNHIWQANEIDLFVTTAKLIGVLLKERNLTLEDLYKD